MPYVQRNSLNVIIGIYSLEQPYAWEQVPEGDPSLQTIPGPPDEVTPLQARKALIKAGLFSQVTSLVASSTIDVQQAWEFASSVNRNDPVLSQMIVQMGLTPAQVDQLFLSAATFT